MQDHTPDQVPLYYVLVWIWAQFTGFTVFPLRLLSTLTGLLALAAVFRFAAESFDRRVALLSALLFSFSSPAVTRFHIIRMLPLVMLLAAIHTWLYWRLAHGKGGRGRDWLAFVLSCGALFYAHILSPFVIVGFGAYHLVFAQRTRRWLGILVAWALGAALILPYLPELQKGIDVVAGRERHPPMPPLDIAAVLGGVLTNFWTPLVAAAFGWVRHGAASAAGWRAGAAWLCGAGRGAGAAHAEWGRELYRTEIHALFPALVAYRHDHLCRGAAAAALAAADRARSSSRSGRLRALTCSMASRTRAMNTPTASIPDFREKYPPLHRYAQILRGKTLPGEYLIGFRTSHYVYFDHPHVGGSFAQYYLETEVKLDGVFLHATEGKYRLKRDVEAVMAARPYLILAHDPRDELPNRELALHHIERAFHACPAFVDEADLHIQRYAHPGRRLRPCAGGGRQI